MFNKIVVSIVSSVVLFACNVNDSTTASDADVVSSTLQGAPEALKTQDSPSVTPVANPATSTPHVSSTVSPVGGIVTDPLAVPSVNVGTNASATSTVTAPAALSQPAPVQLGTPVVAPVNSATTVK